MKPLEPIEIDPLSYVWITKSIRVADAPQAKIVQDAVQAFAQARESGRAGIVTALHIGGLNARCTPGFAEALGRSRLVYADGIAVVLLAKLAGAANVQRAATTDIGIPVIAAIGNVLKRPVRVALVGGKAGLAEQAGENLKHLAALQVVFTTDGYKDDAQWANSIREMRECTPDVVLLGLGSPRELIFASDHSDEFPGALIMTCGGWFGFLAGEEKRAPIALRMLGLEWIGRLVQDPRRLVMRYLRGIATFATIGTKIAFQRLELSK